ncbi:MAG TPA: RNA 2',3'-cyclic phosphodiesterase [Glaciecola sp.]|nr:RNA 2',3'-cyclic phosphodiesterase [Glaciecola sp.]
MRLFIGLGFSHQVLGQISTYRNKALLSDSKNVAVSNFHITLCFLGSIDNNRFHQLESLHEQLSQIQMQAFSLELDKSGYWAKPKIQFIAPSVQPLALINLQHTVQSVGLGLHFPIEKRPYRPHVTLQRKVNAPSVPLFQPNITCEFNTFSLYESVSGATGVKYIKRQTYPCAN